MLTNEICVFVGVQNIGDNSHFGLIDRQLALAVMLLKASIGRSSEADFPQKLEEEIQAVRGERGNTKGTDGLLLIEVRGDTSGTIKEPRREIDDFVICFDAYDKSALAKKMQPCITAALAGLRMASKQDLHYERIAHGSYLWEPGGKVIHSFSAELGSLSAYISSPMSDDGAAAFANLMPFLLRHEELTTVVRLFAQSLDVKTDALRTFIAAWTGLEILVNKLFAGYEKRLLAEFANIKATPGVELFEGSPRS